MVRFQGLPSRIRHWQASLHCNAPKLFVKQWKEGLSSIWQSNSLLHHSILSLKDIEA